MKRLNINGDVLPQGLYVAIQVDSLRPDTLEGDLSEQMHGFYHSLVPHLHPIPGFIVEERVLSQ